MAELDPTLSASARAVITSFLDEYGLGSLGTWAWNRYLDSGSIEIVMLELQSRPEWATRFPAMATLAAEGRAINPATYIAYERQVAEIFHQAGLPSGFYDSPDDFATYLQNNVSVNELAQRVQIAQTAAYSAPVEVRQALELYYGVTPGELTAMALDVNLALPLIQQRYAAAEVAGASQRSGYGLLTQQEAEQIGALAPQNAADTFGSLARSHELFGGLPGTQEDQIAREQQLAAAFGGDANAKETIEKRARERANIFAGDTSYTTDQRGVTGLRTA